MRKILKEAVVLCIALMVVSMTISANPQEICENKLKIVKNQVTPNYDSLGTTGIIEHQKIIPTIGEDIQITLSEEDDFAPAIGIDPYEEYLLAFTNVVDFTENIVPWTFSIDGGSTWDTGVYYEILGTESHPAISYRGSDKLFVGTIGCDPIEVNGAIQYTFECTDPTDTGTYELTYIEWGSSFPYFDRRIPDVAGYNYPEKDWWYGMIAVVGTRDDPGSVDMPIFNYANYEDPNSGWSSYFGEYSGCENAAIDFDLSNGNYYAVFDMFDGLEWDLLILRGNAQDDGSGHPTWYDGVMIDDLENTKYPAIGANEDNVIIICSSDADGDWDLLCYYSDNAGDSWSMSTISSDTGVDELHPTIVSYGEEATCTFIKGDNLFFTKTYDCGETWDTPIQVNDQAGTVENEYRYCDITTDGTVVWTDNYNGNLDIYLDNVGAPANDPPGAPTITGPDNGDAGTAYEYTFSAVDPDDDDVRYIVDWGDGEIDTTSYSMSGVAIPLLHTWTKGGTYTIKARAQDDWGNIGPETTKTVTMPKDKVLNRPILNWLQCPPFLFPLLQKIIQNLGL